MDLIIWFFQDRSRRTHETTNCLVVHRKAINSDESPSPPSTPIDLRTSLDCDLSNKLVITSEATAQTFQQPPHPLGVARSACSVGILGRHVRFIYVIPRRGRRARIVELPKGLWRGCFGRVGIPALISVADQVLSCV